METSVLRVLEGMYIAVLAALAPEHARAANDALRVMADCAKTPLVEALCFHQLAYSAEPLAEPLASEPEPVPPMGILGAFPETVH